VRSGLPYDLPNSREMMPPPRAFGEGDKPPDFAAGGKKLVANSSSRRSHESKLAHA
jgi:hypothetical protein